MKPSELTITLAALPGRYSDPDGWVAADNVKHRLGLLGFECSTQQVASWLGRMSRVDAPWIEKRRHPYFDQVEYRVTQWGSNDIDNRFPGVRPVTPWLPVWRMASASSSKGGGDA